MIILAIIIAHQQHDHHYYHHQVIMQMVTIYDYDHDDDHDYDHESGRVGSAKWPRLPRAGMQVHDCQLHFVVIAIIIITVIAIIIIAVIVLVLVISLVFLSRFGSRVKMWNWRQKTWCWSPNLVPKVVNKSSPTPALSAHPTQILQAALKDR